MSPKKILTERILVLNVLVPKNYFGPKKFFDYLTCIGSKKVFGRKFYLLQILDLKKFLVKKILWSEKKLGQTKFFVKKIFLRKDARSKFFLDPTKFLVKKNFGQKNLGQKNSWSKKNLVGKTFWSKKNFGLKQFLVMWTIDIFGSEILNTNSS